MGWSSGRMRGASLFEFAVVGIVTAVLAAVLLDQVQRYQAEGERAGVRLQIEQMRSALMSRVLSAGISGDAGALHALVGANPVTLLQTIPPNYLGEFNDVQAVDLPMGSWYFDRKQQTLVYKFRRNKSFTFSATKHWSFRVEFIRLPTDNAKPPGTPSIANGVALVQVDG